MKAPKKLRHITIACAVAVTLVLTSAQAGTGRTAFAADPAVVSIDPVSVKSATGSVDIRITAPLHGADLPILVLAHGAALNRSDYRPFVEGIARAGYIVIQPDFPDASDNGLPRSTPAPADNWRIRHETVAWIGANLGDVLRPALDLAERADFTRTAVAGHSFGGHTAALAMGAQVAGAPTQSATAYRAAVLLAPPGNWDGLTAEWKPRAEYLKVDWSPMRGPTLMINGTADVGPMSDAGPPWHDDGFHLATQNICLMHVEGAGHYLGGIDSTLRPPSSDTTSARRAAVLDATVAFLDHSLDRKTPAAERWPALRSTLPCK